MVIFMVLLNLAASFWLNFVTQLNIFLPFSQRFRQLNATTEKRSVHCDMLTERRVLLTHQRSMRYCQGTN